MSRTSDNAAADAYDESVGAKESDPDHDLVDHLLAYRRPTPETAQVLDDLRAEFVKLGHLIVWAAPRTADRTVALRKLHDACQATIGCVVLNQEDIQ